MSQYRVKMFYLQLFYMCGFFSVLFIGEGGEACIRKKLPLNFSYNFSATLKTDVEQLLHDYDNTVRVSVAHTLVKKVEKNLYRLLQIFLLSPTLCIQQSRYIIWPVPPKATRLIRPDFRCIDMVKYY